MPPKPYAIIAGVGPGTGAAIAKRFAKTYSVVLLSRSTNSFSALEKEINDAGGHAVGVATDVVDENGVKEALKVVDEKLGGDAVCAVSLAARTQEHKLGSSDLSIPYFSCGSELL